MRPFLIILFLGFISISVKAQNYTRDAGARFGNGLSVTYRQFSRDTEAMELFVNFYDRGMRIGGMKQMFIPVLQQYSENFMLYYGYGVHAGFTYTNKYQVFNRIYTYDWTFSPVFGMDGIFGLEYYFPDVPIMISTELRPYFEFSTTRYFMVRPINMSLSLKYRF